MAGTRKLIAHALAAALLSQLIATTAVVANPRPGDEPPSEPPGTIVVDGRVIELPTAAEIESLNNPTVLPGEPPPPVAPLDASQVGNTTLTAEMAKPPAPATPAPIESFTVTADVSSSGASAATSVSDSPIRVRRSSARRWSPPARDDSMSESSIASGASQSASPVGKVRVHGLGIDEVRRAGLDVVGFTLREVAAPAAPRVSAASVPVVTVDVSYDASQQRFGANWAERVQLVAMPACVLTTPFEPACSTVKVVPSRNDLEHGVITADVAVDRAIIVTTGPGRGRHVAAGGTPGDTVYGLSSGYNSSTGSFTATPLSSAASWNVGTQMGSFNWSYNVPVPPTGFGTAPSVGFQYSTQSIDGVTPDQNTQAGMLGLGWSLSAGGFIERTYRTCPTSSDFCGPGETLSLNLNGHSSRLVVASAESNGRTEWRLADDPGWRVVQQKNFVPSSTYTAPVADGGELFSVFTPDGTEFRFGQREEPTTKNPTNSVWYVPVKNLTNGTPCAGIATTRCYRPWRWNLDYVRDRNGNVSTYFYTAEKNHYGAFGTNTAVAYIRGGALSEIRYGTREGAEGGYRNKISFNLANRCWSNHPEDGCLWGALDNGPAWYLDAPRDLECAARTVCTRHAPSFFTTLALRSIDTWVLDGTTPTWRAVDRVTPTTEWPTPELESIYTTVPPGMEQAAQLFLRTISRSGLQPNGTGGYNELAAPKIRFDGISFNNRVDHSMHSMYWRVNRVVDDIGGRTDVTYGQQSPCRQASPAGVTPAVAAIPADAANPTTFQTLTDNALDCYPRYSIYKAANTVPPGATPTFTSKAGWGIFNRYLAMQVTQRSNGTWDTDPAATTSYTYEGTPAYRFDPAFFFDPTTTTKPTTFQTWSEPRGYASVTTKVGPGSDGQYLATTERFFRGMTGDYQGENGTPRVAKAAEVTYPDLSKQNDLDSLQGRRYLVEKLGPSSTWPSGPPFVEQEDATFYTGAATAYGVGVAWRTDVTRTEQRIFDRGFPDNIWIHDVRTVYDAYGFPIEVWDRGDPSFGASDSTCVYNEWVRTPTATGAWLLDRLSRSVKTAGEPTHLGGYAGRCDENLEASIADHYYDNLLWGETAMTGRETMIATRAASVIAVPADPWLQTRLTYDAAGHVVSTDGPMTTTNDVTSFGFDDAGFPSTTTDATGHVTATTIDHGRGQTLSTTDRNNVTTPTSFDGAVAFDGPDRTTSMTYDWLGRLLTASLPGDSTPTVTMSYTIPTDVVSNLVNGPIVVARSVKASVDQQSFTFIDGLGRSRETQVASPTTGRLVSASEYDGRGLAVKSIGNYASPGSAGTNMVTPGPLDSTKFPAETRTTYDMLGRVIMTAQFSYGRPVTVGGDELRIGHSYQARFEGISTGPRSAKYLTHDARGLPFAQWTYTFADPFSRTTWFTYDANGNRTRVSDPKENPTYWTYDELGRVLTVNDPDSGITKYTWNNDGTLAQSEDANGTKLAYTYDVLGRKRVVTDVTTSSPVVLERFAFDRSGEAGLLDSASSVYNGAEIKIDTTGYDTRSRPIGYTYTIPTIAGITDGTGFNGSYSFSLGYDAADQQTSVTYPTLGTLPAETVTSAFDSRGAATTLTSPLSQYVSSTTFTAEARIASRSLSGGDGALAFVRGYTWDLPTGRLKTMTATQNGVALQSESLTYDVAGNVVANSHDRPGTSDDQTECFGYDDINRLATAFTNSTAGATSSCAAASSGGPSPYNMTYSYDEIDNFINGPAGAYTYPPSATWSQTAGYVSVRPHAVTTAGSTSFTYRANGSMATKTAGGATSTYGWNPQNRLASVTTPTSTSTMVYGPGGERMLMKDATGVHLYLGPLSERHYTAAAAGQIEKRNYTLGSVSIAVRSKIRTSVTSTVDYILGDVRGSSSMTVRAGVVSDATNRQLQSYTPYGAVRGTTAITNTTRGYIGQQQDPTGLSYLNNRYYDPATGVFLSVDPLSAQTGTPYLYANGNPTTLKDPSGLDPHDGPRSGNTCQDYGYGCPKSAAEYLRESAARIRKLAKDKARDSIYVRTMRHASSFRFNHEAVGVDCRIDGCDFYTITFKKLTGTASGPKTTQGSFDLTVETEARFILTLGQGNGSALVEHLLGSDDSDKNQPTLSLGAEVQVSLWRDGKVFQTEDRSIDLDFRPTANDIDPDMAGDSAVGFSIPENYTEIGIVSEPWYDMGEPVWTDPPAS
jgi:RHS repeat-associated protein